MAEVVKCERGHYYDKSVFIKCPHCEAGIEKDTRTTSYRTEVSRYAMEYLNGQRGRQRPPRGPETEKMPDRAPAREGYQDMEERPVSQREQPDRGDEETISRRVQPDRGGEETISRRAEEDSGKDSRTIGLFSNSQKNYMVTGWLVCVDGPHMGCSFNLYYGYNTIGCSRNNRVCLLEDASVARKVHCSVVYEDRKNCFYLVPEENQETYLNDQCLTEAAKLKNEDRIRVGKTQFVFIAFCSGERKWDRKLMRRQEKYGQGIR